MVAFWMLLGGGHEHRTEPWQLVGFDVGAAGGESTQSVERRGRSHADGGWAGQRRYADAGATWMRRRIDADEGTTRTTARRGRRHDGTRRTAEGMRTTQAPARAKQP